MKLLFLCVANSARSQIAEGLARRIFADAEIRSAGSKPGRLNPYAVSVMREIGIDLTEHYSKSIDALPPSFLDGLDYVITLCGEEVCPILPTQAKRLHWPNPDPAIPEPTTDDEALRRFRATRDALAARLVEFKRELAK